MGMQVVGRVLCSSGARVGSLFLHHLVGRGGVGLAGRAMVRRAAVSTRYGRGSVGSAGSEVECDPWPVAGPGSGVGSSESALGQVSSSGRWRVRLQSLDYPNHCLCQDPFPAGENPVAESGTSESALGRRPLWKVVDPVFGIWAVRVGARN